MIFFGGGLWLLRLLWPEIEESLAKVLRSVTNPQYIYSLSILVLFLVISRSTELICDYVEVFWIKMRFFGELVDH